MPQTSVESSPGFRLRSRGKRSCYPVLPASSGGILGGGDRFLPSRQAPTFPGGILGGAIASRCIPYLREGE